MLEMSGIRKAFGPTVALDGVSISVKRGEVRALVGENGAGKSTLVKVLSGAHAPDAGEMTLDGVPYAPGHPRDARGLGVGMIYQELSLAPHLSVAENIFLGREPRQRGVLDRRTMRTRAREVLQQVGLAEVSPDLPAGELSNARGQLVEIARALASGCRVLVLDEPTSSLGRGDIERLFGLISEWKTQGMAVIYISHFLEEIREIADTCTVMCDGRVAREGRMTALTDAEIVEAMVGRTVADLYPRSVRVQGEAVLRVQTDAADFSLHRGEILGIAGLVGAGRTELLEALFGLRKALEGDVQIRGTSGPAEPVRRWRQGVGMLSEDRKRQGLALSLSVADNLGITRLPRCSTPGWRRRQARQWIERLSIKCGSPDDAARSLSGGNQQKVALGRLMCHDAEILLLDEPTRGIDVGAKAVMYQVLDDWVSGDAPRAVLMVSSYLPELLGVCDRIAVMRRGKLGAPRPVSAWTEHQLMEEAIR